MSCLMRPFGCLFVHLRALINGGTPDPVYEAVDRSLVQIAPRYINFFYNLKEIRNFVLLRANRSWWQK